MNTQPTHLSRRGGFTKRVYIEIARALNEAKPSDADKTAMSQWARDCESVANVMTQHSIAFDRSQFLDNCADGVPA